MTRLGDLPLTWRFVLIASTFLVTTYSYGLLFFSAYCFEEFQLATDRIEDMYDHHAPSALLPTRALPLTFTLIPSLLALV